MIPPLFLKSAPIPDADIPEHVPRWADKNEQRRHEALLRGGFYQRIARKHGVSPRFLYEAIYGPIHSPTATVGMIHDFNAAIRRIHKEAA